MVNQNQNAAEVPMTEVFDVERNKLLQLVAQTVNENARLQVANQTIIGRVREVEAELEDERLKVTRLVEANETLSLRVAAFEAAEDEAELSVDDRPISGD